MTFRPLGGVALLAILASAACESRGSYQCVNAEACDARPDGACEANGACSYPDALCESGRRYGELAGVLSNECVEEGDGEPGADANRCTVSGPNLLSNAGFDEVDPAPWLVDSSAGQALIYLDSDPALGGQITADSAPRLAWLGGAPDAIDSLAQAISVPDDAPGVVVSVRYWVTSAEPNQAAPFDVFVVALDDDEGTPLEDLGGLSNADVGGDWRTLSVAASGAHAGDIVRVRLQSNNDGGQLTNFFLDSLSAQAGTCE